MTSRYPGASVASTASPVKKLNFFSPAGLTRNFHFELHLHPKTYASYPVVSSANRADYFGVAWRFTRKIYTLGNRPIVAPAWMEISARDYTRGEGKAIDFLHHHKHLPSHIASRKREFSNASPRERSLEARRPPAYDSGQRKVEIGSFGSNC